MRYKNFVFILIFIVLLSHQLTAQESDEIPFSVHRLSERVLILTEDSPMENIIVTLASKKGLVVVDVTGSPYTADLMRKIIEKEFGRDDFAYIIDTHHHWDHAWGNQAFADAIIVGHERCVEVLRSDAVRIPPTLPRRKENLDNLKTRLSGLDPNSEEADALRNQLAFQTRIYKGLSDGFLATPPAVTFNDRLTLDLGDLTLKLFFFGRAHSGSDILIQVPEEELLLTGDLFLDIGWLPLFAGMDELDIPRWTEVLSIVLDGDNKVTHVIPGHRKVWTRQKFDMWRDYIVDLWDGVNEAKAEGLKFEEVLVRFPLDKKFDYLKELGHTDDALKRYQSRNVEAFWRQLFESGAVVIEQTLNESGIDAAIQKYNDLKANHSDQYFFGENQFNRLGYRLMGQEKIKEAIEIFKLNVQAFPQSWNVYDSLGEAYMNDRQTNLAIQYYEKSLELNPENENARRILERLGSE